MHIRGNILYVRTDICASLPFRFRTHGHPPLKHPSIPLLGGLLLRLEPSHCWYGFREAFNTRGCHDVDVVASGQSRRSSLDMPAFTRVYNIACMRFVRYRHSIAVFTSALLLHSMSGTSMLVVRHYCPPVWGKRLIFACSAFRSITGPFLCYRYEKHNNKSEAHKHR